MDALEPYAGQDLPKTVTFLADCFLCGKDRILSRRPFWLGRGVSL